MTPDQESSPTQISIERWYASLTKSSNATAAPTIGAAGHPRRGYPGQAHRRSHVRYRGPRGAGRRAGRGMYRDDRRLRPTVALHPTVIPAGTSPARRWSWSTTCCSAVAQHARRWMPCPAPGGQGRATGRSGRPRTPRFCPSGADYVGKTCRPARRRRAGDRPKPTEPMPCAWCALEETECAICSTQDVTQSEALAILDTARELAQVADRPVKKLPTLRGRTVVNLFFEDSTRTRISAVRGGRQAAFGRRHQTSRPRVEPVPGRIPERHGIDVAGDGCADAVVIRHQASGAVHRLATATGSTVRSSTPGTEPTNTPRRCWTRINDARSPARRAGSLEGLNVVIVGMSCTRGSPGPTSGCSTRSGRRHPGGAAHFAAGRRRAVALPDQLRPRRGDREGRCRDDAAGADGADERGLLPQRASIRGATALTSTDVVAARSRDRDAPGADEPGNGNRCGCGRRRPLGDPGPGDQRCTSGWLCSTC